MYLYIIYIYIYIYIYNKNKIYIYKNYNKDKYILTASTHNVLEHENKLYYIAIIKPFTKLANL
jgi:hypothetical protein